MHTRISHIAERVMEAATLAAVLAIPLLFNPYSARVFEGEKVSLLRVLAVIAAAAWLIRYLEQRDDVRPSLSSLREQPVILAALIVGLVTILAGFASITPRLGLWGSYQRGQGIITVLSYLILFFATIKAFTTLDRRRRLITTLLVASAPVSLVAILQLAGLNPMPLQGLDPSRVFGTLSNPIFLGAYLVLVIPLTLAQIARCTLTSEGVRWGGLVGYSLLLVLQLAAAFFTGSQGPWMGVAAGVFVFSLLLALRSRRRWVPAGLFVLAGLALAFVIVLSLPSTPLQDTSVLGSFGDLMSAGSARVRVLIWQGIVDRFAGEPGRLALGYGPESTHAALLPAYQPELRHLEPEHLPDRAHNVFLEALVTTGLVGAASIVLLFAAMLYTGLRGLGWLTTSRARNQWLALMGAGVLLGAFLPRVIEGSWTFAGLGVGAGMVVAFGAYLLLRFLQDEDPARRRWTDRLVLIAGVLAAMLGHLAELTVGIRVTATESVFWVLAGFLVVLVAAPEAKTARSTKPAPAMADGVTLTWAPELAALGILGGVMLSTLAFGIFLLPGTAASTSAAGRWGLLLLSWVLAGWLWFAAPDADISPGAGWIYPLISLAWAGLFITLRTLTPVFGGDAFTLLQLYTVWLLLSLVAVVALLPRPSAEVTAARSWMMAVAPAVGVVALVAAWSVVTPLYADIYLEAAEAHAAAGQWSQALAFYQQAANEEPDVDVYQQHLGEAYATAARAVQDPNQRAALFQAAAEAFQRAARLNPANAAHRFNLARLYLLWGEAATDPSRQATLLSQAEDLYQQLASATPLDPRVLTNLGQVLQLQGETDAALAKYREALELDPQNVEAYLQLGHVYRRSGKSEQALQMYEQAVALDPQRAAAYRAVADLYRQEGRLMDAVTALQRAAELQTTDYTIHQNLALLYQEVGQMDRAVAEARLALNYAPPQQREALQNFIQSLLAARAP